MPLSWLFWSMLMQAKRLSAVQGRCIHPRTYSASSPVMLARLDGMVPLSWLLLSCLQRQETQRSARAGAHPRTHRYCSPVRLPRLEGMVPLSGFKMSCLQRQETQCMQ